MDHKWLATLEQGVQAEIEGVTRQLATSISEQEERYAKSLPEIVRAVEKLQYKVDGQFYRMGLP